MRFPGTEWYVMVTVRPPQMIRDQKKFGKHCVKMKLYDKDLILCVVLFLSSRGLAMEVSQLLC